MSESDRNTNDVAVEEPRVDPGSFRAIRRWLLVFAVTLAFFYAMDQALMSAQGLPLEWTLAPRN